MIYKFNMNIWNKPRSFFQKASNLKKNPITFINFAQHKESLLSEEKQELTFLNSFFWVSKTSKVYRFQKSSLKKKIFKSRGFSLVFPNKANYSNFLGQEIGYSYSYWTLFLLRGWAGLKKRSELAKQAQKSIERTITPLRTNFGLLARPFGYQHQHTDLGSYNKNISYLNQAKHYPTQMFSARLLQHLLLSGNGSYETNVVITQCGCISSSSIHKANNTSIYFASMHSHCKEEQKKTKNFRIGKTVFKRAFNQKRTSIIRAAKGQSYNLFGIKSINTLATRPGLNLWFRSRKGLIPCFALEDRSDSPLIPEKSSKIQTAQGGPSIWIVKKVQNLTEKLIQTKNGVKTVSPRSFNSLPSEVHDLMPHKYSKQRLESQIYTKGLTTHYQLQKNFSKIESGLRQGCQLLTVYVFGSFCWLYLIRYSNQTNELAYMPSKKVDFLFQDLLFETLPLLSERGTVYGETNDHNNLTSRETINYFDNQKKFSSNINGPLISIELTPLFSEKLQNFIGRKHCKSQKLLNSTWKNLELLPKKEQSNLTRAHGFEKLVTPILDFSDCSAGPATERTQERAFYDYENPWKNNESTTTATFEGVGVAQRAKKDQIVHNKSLGSQANTQSRYNRDSSEESVRVKDPSRASNKLNQTPLLLAESPSLRKTAKELIFFARKPMFIKSWSSIFPSIPPTSCFSFAVNTLKQQKPEQEGPKEVKNFYNSSQGLTERAQLDKPVQSKAKQAQKTKRKENSIFFKKQTLTQKRVYNLSGTSLIIDPEIDFLPRKLERSVKFSKIGSCTWSFGPPALPQQEKGLVFPVKKENSFSLNFKPHLTLTESLFWCKTLTKTEIWLSETKPKEKSFFLDTVLKVSSNAYKKNPTRIFLNTVGLKSRKIAKPWFTFNSFEGKSELLCGPSDHAVTQKKEKRVYDLAKQSKAKPSKAWLGLNPLNHGVVLVTRPLATTLGQNQQEHEFAVLVNKNLLTTASNKRSQTVHLELLFQNLFLKKRGSSKEKQRKMNLAGKNKGQFLDLFNQPRLQSGFYFPNAPILQQNQNKLKGVYGLARLAKQNKAQKGLGLTPFSKARDGLGVTINPRLYFLRKDTIGRSPSSFLTKKEEGKSSASYTSQVNSSKGSRIFSLEGPSFTARATTALAKESSFLRYPLSKTNIPQAKVYTLGSVFQLSEKDFFDKNTFLEWLYEPHPKLEYLFYRRANDKRLNLQKNAAQFVVLDKHTDLKTSHSFLDKKLASPKKENPFGLSYPNPLGWPIGPRAPLENVFSYKRNSFTGLLDAPDSFFGTPYLKLGERFTVEKLKNKTKIGTLYSIHSGDVIAPSKIPTKPYASSGTSLKTVFGKKQFTTSQNQTSKKINKIQNLITNARLVTSWSKEVSAPKNISQRWSNIALKDNNLLFSSQEENKKEKKTGITTLAMQKTTSVSGDNASPELNSGSKYKATNAQHGPKDHSKAKVLKLFSFKRISGKANRNITLPFKYYNPGIKRERNIEDTMLILEGYKKSRLFPTIHNDYRGIATQGLWTAGPSIAVEMDKHSYTDQDVDLQSILGGMRQRTETQRVAENLSQPKSLNLKTSEEKSPEKEEYSIRKKPTFGYGIANPFVGPLGHGKHIKQNKKRRLSNYYPLSTSLTVCPKQGYQEAFPQKALGTTNIVEYPLMNSVNAKTVSSQTKKLKGSIQTKGFYFEKLLCSGAWSWSLGHEGPRPVLNLIDFEVASLSPLLAKGTTLLGQLISASFLAKILFFCCTWYSYKLLAIPLSQSTQFLPATFTEAIGLQSFQQKYRIINGFKTKQTFKNLAGAEKTLSELRDLIWTFRLVGTGNPNRKHKFFTVFPYIGSRFGQSRPSLSSKSRNRLLLAGPPGTGKTLLVKALAAEANLPVIVQPVSSLRMISGVENPISALFHVARQIKPCIIFLDELDTLGNDVNVSTGNYTAEQKLGIRLARKYTYTLLLELDGLTSSTRDLLIIGATNRLETLNPALTRAGRFDTILDFNLPSQEVRTALFSFYLGTKQQSRKNKKNTKTRTFKKSVGFAKSFWLESYLAAKCYGLSHASIGTIINESALESMLLPGRDGGLYKPLHTLNTLERAINSVKSLTSRRVQSSNTLSLNSSSVLSKLSKQDSFFSRGKEKINPLTIELKSKKEQKNKGSLALLGPKGRASLATESGQLFASIKPFQPEFLVNRVYQIVGSLIFSKKSKKNNRKWSFMAQGPRPCHCSICFSRKKKKPFYNASSLFTRKSYLAINQKGDSRKSEPINRKDLQDVLLHEYSGVASLSIYTATKPLTFKILARAGLYQDPSYVSATLLTLKILTLQSSFYPEDITKGNFSGQVLNQKISLSEKIASGDNNLSATLITKESSRKFSGFVSQSNLPKVFFPDTNNLASSYAEQVALPQKSILFWRNRKVLKNSFSSSATDSASLTKHSKQAPQTLLMDVKAANRLTTSWFRIYFSRPFFRYDTFHYIENKEYYPKNNYIVKRNKLFQRNVSTLSHATILRNSHVSHSIEKKGKLWSKENRQEQESSFFTGTAQTLLCESSKARKKPGTAIESRQLKPIFFSETKESLYLALVANIFHKSLKFFQKNRELTDYCAYTFLRYGVLYEFYLEAICKKF